MMDNQLFPAGGGAEPESAEEAETQDLPDDEREILEDDEDFDDEEDYDDEEDDAIDDLDP